MVCEAEQFASRIASPTQAWKIVPEEDEGASPQSDFRSIGYVQALPDLGRGFLGGNSSFTAEQHIEWALERCQSMVKKYPDSVWEQPLSREVARTAWQRG